MYSVPPSHPTAAVRWPRTLLLPPRRRPRDRANLGIRLVFALLQLATIWSLDRTPLQQAIQVGVWITLLLGPAAELLPVAWQRLASVLRIFQLVVGMGTAAGFGWWWLGR